jgi:hypothetical protein
VVENQSANEQLEKIQSYVNTFKKQEGSAARIYQVYNDEMKTQLQCLQLLPFFSDQTGVGTGRFASFLIRSKRRIQPYINYILQL